MTDYPFTTDGCSGLFMGLVHRYWRATGRKSLSDKVTDLCVTHDKAYHKGGRAADRVRADCVLMTGVADLGHPFLARLMVIGVGIGGVWWLPFPWRWGYGWKYPRGYQ